MANLRIAPWNFVDEGGVTASSEAGLLIANNIQTVSRSKVWRTETAGADTSYSMKGSIERKATCLFVFRHNLIGKTFRIRLFPNADWTGTPTYDSTALTVAAIGSTPLSYDWGIGTATDPLAADSPIAHYFTEASFKSWQLDVTVATGQYAEIGRLFIGRYLETTYNPKLGSPVLGWETNSEQFRTRGGSLHTNEGEYWRTLQFDLEWIPEAQRYVWMDIMRKAGTARDVVVSLFPGTADRLERDYTLDCKFANLDAITHATNVYRSKRVTLKEC